MILETGELQSQELIALACDAALAGGCDYLKTSTGKVLSLRLQFQSHLHCYCYSRRCQWWGHSARAWGWGDRGLRVSGDLWVLECLVQGWLVTKRGGDVGLQTPRPH